MSNHDSAKIDLDAGLPLRGAVGIQGVQVATQTAVGNSASQDGYGLVLGTNSGYTQNVMNGESTAAVSGGTQMGPNICNGSTTCP